MSSSLIFRLAKRDGGVYGLAIAALLLAAAPAQASDTLALAFELPAAPVTIAPTAKADTALPTASPVTSRYQPLPVPAAAAHPPSRGPASDPAVYQSKAAPTAAIAAQIPPPPPGAVPRSQVMPPLAGALASAEPSQPAAAKRSASPAPASADASDADIALGFPTSIVYLPAAESEQVSGLPADSPAFPQTAVAPPEDTGWIYEGGSDSLVARVVGSAEGTRAVTGERTRHYYGHRDPGNGVWNLGTFSYQHGAASPAAADEKQLARLAQQGKTLDEKAARLGLSLPLEEQLNALDLANQSPAAALNRGGYIDRLQEAYKTGKTGQEAILWARTYAYMNPDTQQWNAPGLGNTHQSIRRDQQRRLQAIAAALAAYQQQTAAHTPTQPSPHPTPAAAPATSTAAPTDTPNTDAINFALSPLQEATAPAAEPISAAPSPPPAVSETVSSAASAVPELRSELSSTASSPAQPPSLSDSAAAAPADPTPHLEALLAGVLPREEEP